MRYGNKGNQATCSSLRMPALVFICLPNPIWGPKFWTRGTRPWLFIVPKHIYPSFGEWKDDLHKPHKIVSGCSRDCIRDCIRKCIRDCIRDCIRSGCSQLQFAIFPTRLQCMLLYNSCIKARHPAKACRLYFSRCLAVCAAYKYTLGKSQTNATNVTRPRHVFSSVALLYVLLLQISLLLISHRIIGSALIRPPEDFLGSIVLHLWWLCEDFVAQHHHIPARFK